MNNIIKTLLAGISIQKQIMIFEILIHALPVCYALQEDSINGLNRKIAP